MPQIRFPDTSALDDAVELLRQGRLVAVPTETVYGLAADATNGKAVAEIYAAKGRPSFNPLIAHVYDAEMAARYAHIDDLASLLMERFWPGPLTLVVPKRTSGNLADIVTAGLATVALRSPDHPVPRQLIERLGRPLAAPSANTSGRISPTTAAHVAASLGERVPLILDGGACGIGLESTIIAVADGGIRLLRPGSVSFEELANFAPVSLAAKHDPITAPGQLKSHYAPAKPVRLDATTARDDEFHIGFGEVAGDLNLSVAGSLTEAAAVLFAALHTADASERAAIAVASVPKQGLGLAINDRLHRASTVNDK
ncbi:L-threonylcarbamoyladenylate synthase [Pacificimonas sp. ICDLI1SI03]